MPEQFDEHIKLHFDLLALAFQADITRVATLLGARDLTSRVYPFPKSELFPEGGTSVSFHGGSHHQDDPGADQAVRAAEPLSRLDAGVLRGEAEVDSRRRRHAARSLADSVRHQHGQLESASALRRAAHPGRRRQRPAEGQSSPCLRPEDGDDRQPAAEHPRHVRHPQGRSRATAPGRLAKLVVRRTGDAEIARGQSLLVLSLGALVRRRPSDVADAVMNGDTPRFARCSQKADVNAPQVDGATALHWAVYRDDLQAADLLIARRRERHAPPIAKA